MVLKKVSLQKTLLLFEYIIISFTGVCLLYFGIIDQAYKIVVLSGTAGAASIPVALRLRFKKWNRAQLGISFKFSQEAISWYRDATEVGILVLLIYSITHHTVPSTDIETLLKYSVLGAALQESLYRSYLWFLGIKIFGNGTLNIVVNVVVFVGMHVFYPGFVEKLWIFIPAGIGFTLLYREFRNIFLIMACHIALNAVGILLGCI